MTEEDKELLLAVRNVKKRYSDHEVLKGISFNVRCGDILGYIGANGAGKTTTIRAITGLCSINEGEITVNKNIKDFKIGVVLDKNGLYSQLTARENMEFYLRIYFDYNFDTIIDEYLELVGLRNYENVKVMKYSKGMKRRLVLARTLAIEPNLLILDEPFDGLDVDSQLTMIKCLKNWVKKSDRGIIYTSHNMSEVKMLCNRIVLIKDGEIIQDNLVDEIIKEYFKYLRIQPFHNNTDVILGCIKDLYDHYIIDGENILIYTEKENVEEIAKVLFSRKTIVKEFAMEYADLNEIFVKENSIDEG